MPATTCTNPVLFRFDPEPACQFQVELTWDGTSTPPNCNGTVSRVFFNNTGPNTWYAHLPSTKLGAAVYRIDPGATQNVTQRGVLHAAGLDDRSDLTPPAGQPGLVVNNVPPQAGERLLN